MSWEHIIVKVETKQSLSVLKNKGKFKSMDALLQNLLATWKNQKPARPA